jgi:hypothetical protein
MFIFRRTERGIVDILEKTYHSLNLSKRFQIGKARNKGERSSILHKLASPFEYLIYLARTSRG